MPAHSAFESKRCGLLAPGVESRLDAGIIPRGGQDGELCSSKDGHFQQAGRAVGKSITHEECEDGGAARRVDEEEDVEARGVAPTLEPIHARLAGQLSPMRMKIGRGWPSPGAPLAS